MADASSFLDGFSNLVWLLIYSPSDAKSQKAALKRAVVASRLGDQAIQGAELALTVSAAAQRGFSRPEEVWHAELTSRMQGHAVSALEFTAPVPASEVLDVARVLARDPVRGDEGVTFDAAIRELTLTAINVHIGRDGFVRRATPPMAHLAIAPPARTPSDGVVAVEGIAHGVGVSDLHRHGRRAEERPADATRQLIQAAITRHTHSRGLDDLFIRLRGAERRDALAPVLDDLCRAAEDYAAEGIWAGVLDIVEHIMERNDQLEGDEFQRVFAIQYRRLSKAGILAGLGRLLAHRKDARDSVNEFFRRIGEPAADVLLDLLISSDKAAERRAYRDAIVAFPSTAAPLIHLLGDARWFVVRNAAELLGEMRVEEAVEPLIDVLGHLDSRCRRAATHSLGTIGTKRALHAVAQRLSDTDSGVRLQAALAIGASANPRAEPLILDALEREEDGEVASALLAALGRAPTLKGIQRLADEARPGSILNRRPQALRLAAVQALGEASTREAQSVLRNLADDRDREIRDLAQRLLRGA